MCKLLLEPVNLLILDEPTNHLDIRSKEILKDALKRYDGTMILISHDRDFLKGLTDKLYEFSEGNVKEHLGGIEEFLRSKKADDIRVWEASAKKVKEPNKHFNKKDDPNTYQLKKDLKKEIRTQKSQVNTIEKKVSQLEEDIELMNDKLKEPDAYSNPDNKELIKQWQENSKKLQELMHNWEKEQGKLEEIEVRLNSLN